MPAQHVPNDQTRHSVKTLSAYGMPQPMIAMTLQITDKTLRLHYRMELDLGKAEANVNVAQKLYDLAMSNRPGHVTAMIFWLKCQAGWSEKVKLIGGDPGDTPLENLDLSKLTMEQIRLLASIEIPGDFDDETVH